MCFKPARDLPELSELQSHPFISDISLTVHGVIPSSPPRARVSRKVSSFPPFACANCRHVVLHEIYLIGQAGPVDVVVAAAWCLRALSLYIC
jgi:hypothetical protein